MSEHLIKSPTPLYQGVAANVVDELNHAASEIKAADRIAGRAVITIGMRLLECKLKIPRGQWFRWLSEVVGMSPTTAREYMQIAKHFGGQSIQTYNLSASILWMLSNKQVPESAKVEILKRAEVGHPPSKLEAKRIRKAHELGLGQTYTIDNTGSEILDGKQFTAESVDGFVVRGVLESGQSATVLIGHIMPPKPKKSATYRQIDCADVFWRDRAMAAEEILADVLIDLPAEKQSTIRKFLGQHEN